MIIQRVVSPLKPDLSMAYKSQDLPTFTLLASLPPQNAVPLSLHIY